MLFGAIAPGLADARRKLRPYTPFSIGGYFEKTVFIFDIPFDFSIT